jgi:RNA polymerase sigma-70 factor (ECF subfamily)
MPPDQRLADFEAQRPRLLRLAYRMLGSLSEAEDVVQDAWPRWAAVNGGVDVPAAYLTRIVSRLCLDHLKSARARREEYVGAWLPEPLLQQAGEEAIADDVTLTLMMAMERLSPLERAAFLLHDIFETPLNEVAAALERKPATVRQLASRARRHVREARPRYALSPQSASDLVRAFHEASTKGDIKTLSGILADQVTVFSDGGGKVLAFRNVVRGLDRVLRLFQGLARKAAYRPQLLRTVMIDGLPGFVSIDRGAVLQTTALEVRDGKITALYIVRNPDKLQHVEAMLAEGSDVPVSRTEPKAHVPLTTRSAAKPTVS